MDARDKYRGVLGGKTIHINEDNGCWREFKIRDGDGAEINGLKCILELQERLVKLTMGEQDDDIFFACR